jgi:archaellum biogenesis ATPase FlaH
MTVQELIKQLESLDQELTVVVKHVIVQMNYEYFNKVKKKDVKSQRVYLNDDAERTTQVVIIDGGRF